MFEKIMIADRGEIAVRIIRTCKRLGIKTTAVHSEADAGSLHVRMADEAVYIGGRRAHESYPGVDKIIAAALSAGCQAIHPGYGFLSENHHFAKAVSAAGLVFIGPSARIIDMLGDKISSKELAVKACVPVIPGHADPLDSVDDALLIAGSIGYPVLLKPACGVGGKGLRIVNVPDEMEAALEESRRETCKYFGSSRVFMERFIEKSRHLEVQIIADSFGNIIHLGERESSIQRRYQKIIEEAPSPAVSADLRRCMGRYACDLARKAGYVNAGTVEFMMDEKKVLYFLEMSTRLQAGHPVTEMTAGLDLVELQFRIAAGERLPLSQDDVTIKGWSMAAHICAEDPARKFLPAAGRINGYSEPCGDSIRVDSGVNRGSIIGLHDDSMLATVVCHEKDREAARAGLVEALNGCHIEGVVTNIAFANSVLRHPGFVKGNISTSFIEQHFDDGRSKCESDELHEL